MRSVRLTLVPVSPSVYLPGQADSQSAGGRRGAAVGCGAAPEVLGEAEANRGNLAVDGTLGAVHAEHDRVLVPVVAGVGSNRKQQRTQPRAQATMNRTPQAALRKLAHMLGSDALCGTTSHSSTSWSPRPVYTCAPATYGTEVDPHVRCAGCGVLRALGLSAQVEQ